MPLSLAGADDTALAGDLDVLKAVTITGASSATTIIRGGTTVANGVDKIFSLNPLGNRPGFPVSMSGVTLRFGRNTDPSVAGGNNIGGAVDFDAGFGANFNGLGTLTLNDVIFDQNSTTNGDGGGLALFDGGTVNVTNCQFTNNRAVSNATNAVLGGGIFVGFPAGHATNYTFNTCTITGNSTAGMTPADGGGFYSFAGGMNFHGCTISNNTANGASSDGGGIRAIAPLPIDQGTIITGNTATRWGGGIFATGIGLSISNTTITNNTGSGNGTTAGFGGGGIFTAGINGTATVSNCRIAGNVSPVGGSQLGCQNADGATMNAINNWFGTNAPPASFFGVGVTASPNLVLAVTAVPNTVVIGQASTVTAAITKNTSNVSGFTVPNGTPVSYSAVLGTMSAGTGMLTSGTGTSTFTPTGVGAGSGAATVDSQTISTPITINKAGTTTAIVSDAPDPSVVGQNYTVTATVSVTSPGSGTPTGTISVSDGTNIRTITPPATSVLMPSTSSGPKTLTATYNGDANFIVSVSPAAGHLVNTAPTITGQQAISTPEETARAIVFADLTVTDPNNPYPTGFTLTVMAGANYAFAGNTITPALNFNGALIVPVKVNDGLEDSNVFNLAVSVTAVNDAPVLAAIEGTAVAYTENDPATPITGTITVADVDSATLVSAKVQITGNYANGEDLLEFTNQLGITGVFTPATGLMTLSGTTSVANYQTALRAVTYRNTSDIPGTPTRTVSFFVNDGGSPNNLSNTLTRNITVAKVNDPPVITGQAALSTAFNTARSIALADLLVTDPDNTYPTGFTLTVMNGANYTRAGNTITPALNFFGTLSVPAKVNDGLADSNIFNLVVTVNPDPVYVKVASSIAPEPGGGFRISFIGNPGQTYTIQFVASFPLSPTPIPWQFLGTRTADATGHYSIVEVPPPGTPMRFYRSIFP